MPIPLTEDMDASRWAKEFAEKYPQMISQIPGHEGVTNEVADIMLGWFANAIMCGHDNARRQYEKAP